MLWGSSARNSSLRKEAKASDMCAKKFPLVSMVGLAEGLACADPGARPPIGASGIFLSGL